jgi:glutamyl-tRNA reductase
VVGGVDLHAGRSGLSPLAYGRVHRAARSFAAGICLDCANRRPPSGEIAAESLAGISRFDFDRRLWCIRARLHRGRDVPHSRAPDQNASIAFYFLSFAAADGSFRSNHAAALVGFCALHARDCERVFYGAAIAACASGGGYWGLAALRGDFARPASSTARAKTRCHAMHCRIWRGHDASLGNYLLGPDTFAAMNVFCVGLSHRTANVETLEYFAGHVETECILRNTGCMEALLLTTCNRVEVYGASDKRVSTDEIARCLARKAGVSATVRSASLEIGSDLGYNAEEIPPFYRYEGEKCVQHLFRVASGLDSMVVGETEILGQAKKAYESARASGAAGAYLHRLFQRAFRVAKQVRTRTEITRGFVSVGSVAVDLAQRIFGRLSDCKVLVLGAGEASERTARALASRGVRDLRVSNRSSDRAQELARLVGAQTVPFDQWPEQSREIDILITSTSSETPLLTPENLAPMLRDRIDRPLFIIDIAVPRDVDPRVNEMEGVYLYDIDSLQSVADQSLALRRQQIAAAEAIIAEHVADFGDSISRGLSRASRTAEHPSVADSSLRASEL